MPFLLGIYKLDQLFLLDKSFTSLKLIQCRSLYSGFLLISNIKILPGFRKQEHSKFFLYSLSIYDERYSIFLNLDLLSFCQFSTIWDTLSEEKWFLRNKSKKKNSMQSLVVQKDRPSLLASLLPSAIKNKNGKIQLSHETTLDTANSLGTKLLLLGCFTKSPLTVLW